MTYILNNQELYASIYSVMSGYSSDAIRKQKLNEIICNSNEHIKKTARKKIQKRLKSTQEISIFSLTPYETDVNIQGYLEAYAEEIQKDLCYKINPLSMLHLSEKRYKDTDAVYKNTEQKNLSMGKFLKVVGYALKVAGMIGFPTEKASKAVTGLKVIERIASKNINEDYDLRDLGLAVEVISEAGKHFETTEQAKNVWDITSLSFNMTIDFLTKE